MQTKVYLLENLCCANCGAKIERKLNEHPQIHQALLVFPTRQLRITGENPDSLLEEMIRIAQSIEPEMTIHPREEVFPPVSQGATCGHDHHHHHGECSCGHDHHHHEECICGHDHHPHHEECACGHDHHHHEECTCGHDHHHHEECTCGHDHHHHEECTCGHDHHHHEECTCGHDHTAHSHNHNHRGESPFPLILGGVLFVAGLVLPGLWSTASCLAALVLLGWKVMGQAITGLFRGRVLDENFLMSAASIGAFFIGNAPEGVGVMLFYRVGEYFEHRAVERSRSQIMDAVDLRPETVTLAEGEVLRQIPAGQARPGDLLLVRPGDRIPLDAVVVAGESRLDTAPITGEPVPVAVRPGDSILSGCVNTQGQLTIRVEKPLSESMVTRILRSVESAAAGKPRIDRFITRFSRIYTPVVVALAAVTAIVPSVITGDWNYWVYTALSFLVMSCPCALVLSVPLAFFSGIGAGSRKGILFKDGASMEALAKVKAVAMDKTGTLTRGDFRVQQALGEENLLAICGACEEASTHPIGVSIVSAAREQGHSWQRPEQLREIPGRGIQALLEGRQVLVGNALMLREQGVALPEQADGYGTRIHAAVDGRYIGTLVISDTVKPDAAQAVEQLKQLGCTPVMLTGDAREAARQVADMLKIPHCLGGLLPQDKLEHLSSLRREQGAVLFVGDGINDAPVLAGADVGAAMGSGADAAIEAADLVFMTSQAQAIPQAIAIARRTARIAWQNVAFALGIKAVVMLLGLLGWASMWLAVFADSGVAMLCVLNSIRLLYRNREL